MFFRRAKPTQGAAAMPNAAQPDVMPAVDQDLYRRFPSLAAAETRADHRAVGRREILELVPKGSVGAELGVFAGLFSRVILQDVQPSKLYLVDPWWSVYGEMFPSWGAYTDFGKLSTRAAHTAALERTQSVRGASDVEFSVSTSFAWLEAQPDESLDWVYLDSTHVYEDTLRELRVVERKIKPNGTILGDDYWTEPGNQHYGVVQAVHEFVRTNPFMILRADKHQQYALRRQS